MQVFSINMPAFWLSICLMITTALGSFPSLMPRHGVAIDAVRNANHAPNGAAAKARAMAKYAHLVDSEVNNLNDYETSSIINGFVEKDDREWLCPVEIGTPLQTVNLDLDTGSADLWVFSPKSGSKKGELGNRNVYNPDNSTSSRVVNGSFWSISYGDGSAASGDVYRDTVSLAGLSVHNATVELATSFSSNLVKDDAPLSGLMGLAINLSTTTVPPLPPIIRQLSSQGIGHIGVDLNYRANGTYNFGSIDRAAFTGTMMYQNVKPSKGYWWIDLTTMRVGDSNKTMIHSWDTIVDTGTSLFLAPSDIVDRYYNEVKSALFSEEDDAYVFHCNETLPDFHFGFADTQAFSDSFSDNWSDFRVPGAYMNYSMAPGAGAPWCYGGIQESNMGFSIMGDVFLKAVYVDFNIANKSVGFARKHLDH